MRLLSNQTSTGLQKGLCRTVIADGNINAELVPVDLVANGAIAASMKTAVDFSMTSQNDNTTGDHSRKRGDGLYFFAKM